MGETNGLYWVRVRTLQWFSTMVDIDRAECLVIEAAVAKRLRPVCPDMSAADFSDLVRSAAFIQFKYERQQDAEARILFGIFADNTRIAAGL